MGQGTTASSEPVTRKTAKVCKSKGPDADVQIKFAGFGDKAEVSVAAITPPSKEPEGNANLFDEPLTIKVNGNARAISKPPVPLASPESETSSNKEKNNYNNADSNSKCRKKNMLKISR